MWHLLPNEDSICPNVLFRSLKDINRLPMKILIKTACNKHSALLASTITTIIALKAMALAPPLLLGQVIDTLNDARATTTSYLIFLTSAFTAAGCLQAVINPLQIFVLSKLVQQVVMSASIEWIAQLMRKEFLQFYSWRVGHFIKSVERGITAHEQLLTFLVSVGLPLCLELLIVGGAFIYMGGTTIFLSMVVLAIIYLYVAHRIIKWRRKHIDAVNEQEDEVSALLFTTLNSGKSIKLECTEHTATRPLNEAFTDYADAAVTVASSGGFLSGAKILFVSLATGGLLCWGVLDQLSGKPSITVGQLVAIFSIAGSFLFNITAVTEGYRVLDQFIADQRRLQHLLSMPNFDDDNRTGVFAPLQPATLKLEPCVLEDDGDTRLSIECALVFPQGETVAITGPSGSGKSTLLEILAGLNASARCHLSIAEMPIDELNAKSHLHLLRYCPQSPDFLEGGFNRSVLFGVDPAPDLPLAIARMKLEDIVSHRQLSENATNISGGEAKRLSLLRLINKPGHFNLFDEPTASIEPKMAEPVWDLLFDTFAKRGLICVTHDVQHLHRFDRVIVMQEGAIVDDGPWCELADSVAIQSVMSNLQPTE